MDLCSYLMIYESHVNVQCEHRMWFELSEEFKGGETLKVQAVRKETTAWLFCTLWSVAAFLLLSTEFKFLSRLLEVQILSFFEFG